MIELVVVVATIILLAAAVAPRLLTWVDEGRSARALSDAATIAAAMNRFFEDTARWPGQVEILAAGGEIRFLTVGTPLTSTFPALNTSVGIGAATCVSGLSGVQPHVTSFAPAAPTPANSLDLQKFLIDPPPVADYPNWQGPYLSDDTPFDPWGSVYIVNVIPLFCGETVTVAAPTGALGMGWILSGGPNRLIQTPFTDRRPDADTDDIGVPLGKRAHQAAS